MVNVPATADDRTRSRWIVVIPAITAVGSALGCTVLAVIFAGLANFNDVSAVTAVHQRWQVAGPAGECLLAASALVVLVLGLRRAAMRPRLATAAALIIPIEVGWLLVTAFFGGLWSS